MCRRATSSWSGGSTTLGARGIGARLHRRRRRVRKPSYAVEAGTRYGRRSFAVVRETYGDFALEPVRFLDAGGDDVVVRALYRASGAGSGVPVSGEHGYVWTVQGGKAVRFRWFASHREALEYAGLSADDTPD
jgi:hypothetical protein